MHDERLTVNGELIPHFRVRMRHMLKRLAKLFDSNARELKKLKPLVDQTNVWEAKIKPLSDQKLASKTDDFKQRINQGQTVDDFLPEALATIREAIRRTTGERAYDVQLLAAITLHHGKIAEQKTGEGKTLSAALAAYLHALYGKGVHIVTVNDYLARRDAGWYGQALNLLGLSVGVIFGGMGNQPAALLDQTYSDTTEKDERLQHLKPVSRQQAYQADITYGTNNEFGFDYLRDNMVQDLSQKVQRGHYFAIVDEVDSILIDEARTPLIISAPDNRPTDKYYQYAQLVKTLSLGTDYEIDEKLRTATLTDYGIRRLEQRLGVKNLYEESYETVHHIEQALKAATLFEKNKHYVIKDNQVIIVDEHTGRLMYGRRYSDGLHQAIEAKEGVPIQSESRTLATISLQNYFRMYERLAGMTGTAATEGEEFKKIYNLDVVIIPTNKPVIRQDYPDLIFKTVRAKYAAIVKDVVERHRKGQPILIGTKSIEHNEIISHYLKRKKIPHNVLNAKNHAKEAEIIADAGRVGAVTVATNIAGRGVDIILGGDPADRDPEEWRREHQQVLDLGGLHVIGAERHDSRRIDNQLRGRSGRQGDPGSSRFYVSLEDDLMRIFGGEKIASLMTMLKIPEDQPIEHSMISKSIEQAQVKVESFYFDMRKRVVEYDDVANKHRQVIYSLRDQILTEAQQQPTKLHQRLLKLIDDQIAYTVDAYQPPISSKDIETIVKEFVLMIPFDDSSQEKLRQTLSRFKEPQKIKTTLQDIAHKTYQARTEQFGERMMTEIEKFVYLSTIDEKWMSHLDNMDSLREGIGLRGYAQRDPLVEYQQEAYNLFAKLIDRIEQTVVQKIYRFTPMVAQQQTSVPQNVTLEKRDILQPKSATENQLSANKPKTIKHKKKLSRNDPCWCGSGKKWKKCHYPELPPEN